MLNGNRQYGPTVQMSPKADLETSSEREHHHGSSNHHHHLHHPHSPHHSSHHSSSYPAHTSIQSLPIPASSSSAGNRYGAPLPALQDPRYTATTGSSYDSHSPTSASSVAYSPFSSNGGFQPTSYPSSATSSSFPSSSSFPAYSLSSSDSRPRIPSLVQSPTSGSMAPHHRSSSGSTKSLSPGLSGSSVRADYSTSTPHLSRHLPSRSSQSDALQSPHSPLTPGGAVPRSADALSPTIGSLNSPIPAGHEHGQNGLGVNHAGPPLAETQVIFQLSSNDGHVVRPEIHARVDKGFFMSDRDWTCYRRNYFSVICSYSLFPTSYSLPLYLRRLPNSPPEPIVSFAMCISAVVDAPGGKSVELVQHTPKRDKGPQHRPAKIKLNPQPAGGMSFAPSGTQPIAQPHAQGQGSMDHEFTFPQQSQQAPQHIAVFDRIQFKSATANNGKRRAAQQYYHLIVELYANLSGGASTAPPGQGTNSEGGDWVKIAYRVSAPMVVRGRSPGHYADERRASTSSPGGGNTGGNNPSGPHPSSHGSSGPGYMGPDGMSQGGQGGSTSGVNMHGMHHHNSSMSSPATSSIHNPSSIASASPSSHIEPPIDPVLDSEGSAPLDPSYPYSYVPAPLYESPHLPAPSIDSGYETHSYNSDRKSEHLLETSCSSFESDRAAYIPTTMSSAGSDAYSHKPTIKEEFSSLNVPWLGSGAIVGREQRFGGNNTRCGRFEHFESSKGWYPDVSPLI